MEIELEHYRELIVWQLQKRAYLAQRLYEIRDSISLSALKSLLMQELAGLRSNGTLDFNFEKALDSLRAIDDKVQTEASSIIASNGAIILPWINRLAIDRIMGRRNLYPRANSESPFRFYAEPAEWRKENIVDDEVKKIMEEVYAWILCYIRALAIIGERLYIEKNLQKMTQLHSILVNNRNVSYTEVDSVLQRWSTESYEQRRFDTRRFYIITRHFWHHQRRRQDGDMTVGDIILPWVEVRDEWFGVPLR